MKTNQLDEQARAALEAVLDYLMPDEQWDFEAVDEPENHIFRHLKTLRQWLDEDKRQA